jgi:hypothetical protein
MGKQTILRFGDFNCRHRTDRRVTNGFTKICEANLNGREIERCWFRNIGNKVES